jgi:hypothetical protein
MQHDALAAGEFGARIEQVGLAAAGGAPQAELDFVFAADQRLEAGDNQFRARRDEIVEAELPVERQRQGDLFNYSPPRSTWL